MLHQIGVGALGPVFRTYEPTRDRLVAVKVFRLDVTPEQARALADELGRAADAGLFHSSIVEPVAAGLEGTVAYRAEEYVAAESLDVAMRHYAPATLDKVLPFITQLASAIDFARAAGVGHGALHPRDIFVTPDEARATGFGVVDAMDRLGLRAPVRRPYSPPERIAGHSWTTAADVFSLAAIAFELLTGRRPSGVGDDMGSLSGAALDDCADAVRVVLAKAMGEKPEQRFQTAQEFSAALAAAAGIAETPVAVAPQPVVAVPALPVGPEAESVSAAPVEQGSADPVSEIAQGSDGAAEVDLSLTDSPREAARKAIAAREVKKRQHKKKGDSALFEVPREETAPSQVIAAEALALPEAMPIPLPVESSPTELESAAPEAVSAGAIVSDDELREDPADDLTPIVPPIVSSPIVSSDEEIDLVATGDGPIEIPALEAVQLDRQDGDRGSPDYPRDTDYSRDPDDSRDAEYSRDADHLSDRSLPDRVVAVDEFRAREAVQAKPERTWPRASERSPLDRAQFESSDRTESPSVSSGLHLGGGAMEQETPAAYEGAPSDRQRVLMLPLALVAGLCLIVGYAVGYFVRGRESADVPGMQTAATTGTGSKPAADAGGVAPPSSAPGVPAEPRAVPPANPEPARSSIVKPAATAAGRKSTNTAAKVGHLVVNSTPAKAGVTVNGKWSGRTPLTLSDLKFGKYVVRIVEPGYEVQQQRFTLSSGAASRTMDVTLKRKPEARQAPAATAKPQEQAKTAEQSNAATTGSIYIDSRPQGARVFIDNKQLGVTPVTLSGQAAGSHVVRLELADHGPRSETVTVKPGATTRVTGSLERIR